MKRLSWELPAQKAEFVLSSWETSHLLTPPQQSLQRPASHFPSKCFMWAIAFCLITLYPHPRSSVSYSLTTADGPGSAQGPIPENFHYLHDKRRQQIIQEHVLKGGGVPGDTMQVRKPPKTPTSDSGPDSVPLTRAVLSCRHCCPLFMKQPTTLSDGTLRMPLLKLTTVTGSKIQLHIES